MSKKRILSGILAAVTLLLLIQSICEFDHANTSLEAWKALFWILTSSVASICFIDNIKNNQWPWEG